AMLGALITATVLVEILGFRHTLWVASAANFSIAAMSLALGLRSASPQLSTERANEVKSSTKAAPPALFYTILFTTGGSSLALEVIWTRVFTPILGTQVYSFAYLLFIYLLATWYGSSLYRRNLKRACIRPIGQSLAVLAVVVYLPIVLNDPRVFHGAE